MMVINILYVESVCWVLPQKNQWLVGLVESLAEKPYSSPPYHEETFIIYIAFGDSRPRLNFGYQTRHSKCIEK